MVKRRASDRNMFERVAGLLILVWLTLNLTGSGFAEGAWLTLSKAQEQGLQFLVAGEYTGEVTATFLGDCTLGGLESRKNSSLGFVQRIEENGYAFPFRNLLARTGKDDLTVANLEGVLSDRKLKKVPKEYNFIGPTAYTEILKAGSIDCANLANNHSHDYGDEGYADTKAALEEAGIAWIGTDEPAVWRNPEGLMIGFLGVGSSLSGNRYTRFRSQAEALKELGCAAIVTVMHAGTEYSYSPPDSFQEQISRRAAECGSCLVIGHHPHVVQGLSTVDGIPVVYSLGNCSFGGTTHARDHDALMVQAVFRFREGELKGMDLHFYPISMTSDSRYNNYSPRMLEGEDAQRVLEKMRKSTGTDVGEWTETEGAVYSLDWP
ncbi:MAG: CapA family protein [Clostridia bacterium]|nr:CapA family protein [Clostridia bacterium]